MRLGDVAKFVRGITFKPEDVVPRDAPDAVWCFRTKNVQAELDMSDVWALPERFIRSPDRYLQTGDVLVSSANSWNLVGKCCWVPELPRKGTCGGFVSVLRASDESVDPRYLFRWFSSPRIQETLRSFGQQTTSISNLNIERSLALALPLPSRIEQSRVVAVLEGADGLRRKRREALAQLDALTQSIFIDMFGDSATKPNGRQFAQIDSLADVQGGIALNGSRANLPLQVPYLRVANVHRARLDLSEVKMMSVTEAELKRNQLAKDDLLIVEGHGNPEEIGRAALWDGSITPCVHQNHLIRVRFDARRVLPRFACEFLNSPGGRRYLLRSGKTTSGLNTINVSEVRRTPVAVPPMELQGRFVERAASVDQLRARALASMAELNALFASLQHRAFNGDL